MSKRHSSAYIVGFAAETSNVKNQPLPVLIPLLFQEYILD
ncbi:hypothetical protein OAU21_02450 [Gammaproteobacteria bacterium]|nr:hypothetical protein [Gammaproteobacteria bacterium]